MKKIFVILPVLLLVSFLARAQGTAVPDASCAGGFTSQINGEYIDIYCFTPTPTQEPLTATATSTAIATSTAAPTETPVPPTATSTATPTATMTYLPTVINTATATGTPTAPPLPTDTPTATATAVPPTGIGVIGDSASEPYQSIGRGGPDSYAWTELARDWRGVDFGPNDTYIAAVSGNTTAHIDDQVQVLAPYIQTGDIWRVIEFIGVNDLWSLCNTHYSTSQYNNLRDAMLTNFEAGTIDLIATGIDTSNVYIVTQGERSALQSCSNYVQYNALVAEINAGLETQAAQYGFNLIDVSDVFGLVYSYVINSSGDISINGHIVYNQYCDFPTCQWLADVHPNTALNGLTLNALFADALNIAPMSDGEIAQAAGLE